jgi:hypothetical protein
MDVCGNSATSDTFEVGVWHSGARGPTGGTIYSPDPGSGENDTRSGATGTYGAGCGAGNPACGRAGPPHESSDPKP